MRLLIQRCLESSVSVQHKVVGRIQNGLVILVGFTDGDSEKEIDYLVNKVVHLRIFDDDNGVMNRSILEVGGSILSISQFTLYADLKKGGRRPSYAKALNGDEAICLYQKWNEKLKSTGVDVATGIFGADMQVSLINDGPVTIMLEKESGFNEK